MGVPFNPCFFLLLFPLIMLLLYFAHGEDEFLPSNCMKGFFCAPNMGYLEFPFAPHTHPHCGLILVDCDAKPHPNIQLETGGDWYQLLSNDLLGSNTIFLEDSKLERLIESSNYSSNLTYTLQFHNPQSITFSNFEASPFLECNHSPADDIDNYDICIEGFSFSLKYKHKLVPENPKCDSVNCTLYPSPILVQQTNSLLTPHFGLHLKVSPTCYGCYHGGGICRADSNNEFECGIDKLPSNCTEKFLCGSTGYLEFPFAPHTHPHCGLILVDCDAEQFPTLQLETGGDSYQLQHVKPLPVWGEYVIFLGDVKLQRLLNLKYPSYSNLNYTLQFPYSPSITFLNLKAKQLSPTFLKCNYSEAYDDMGNYERYKCTQEFNFTLNYKHPSSPQNSNCTLYPTPIVVKRTNTVLTAKFGLEFHVSPACYDCYYIQGGQCTTDSKNKFHCKKGKSKLRLVLITVLSGGLGLSLVSLAIFVVWRLKKLPFCACMDMITEIKNYQAVEEFLANHGPLAPKRFSYSEVKKITNSFKDELGQGGFGSVYKGKLCNGCYVAVKVLKELKTNGEEFINEVASISRTSHVNIVTLIGYCIEGRKRVLVYEFMPNGSLEKFIYDNKSLEGRQLEWSLLIKISIGIARGLEYLHNGCNTRIIHLDIKPHNILLDEDFSPKISDFGLAKLCTKKESIVSIFGARGTIGYIAPEVVLNNIGGVSHKSDVYSYGMMVLEMVGGRKNVDIGASRNSKIYFPHWIYTRLALDDELGLMGVMNEEDNNCARKMLIVSLWCIQTDPSTRPSISRVVEMLEGKLEYLQIPPKPYLYSPTRSEEQH